MVSPVREVKNAIQEFAVEPSARRNAQMANAQIIASAFRMNLSISANDDAPIRPTAHRTRCASSLVVIDSAPREARKTLTIRAETIKSVGQVFAKGVVVHTLVMNLWNAVKDTRASQRYRVNIAEFQAASNTVNTAMNQQHVHPECAPLAAVPLTATMEPPVEPVLGASPLLKETSVSPHAA